MQAVDARLILMSYNPEYKKTVEEKRFVNTTCVTLEKFLKDIEDSKISLEQTGVSICYVDASNNSYNKSNVTVYGFREETYEEFELRMLNSNRKALYEKLKNEFESNDNES